MGISASPERRRGHSCGRRSRLTDPPRSAIRLLAAFLYVRGGWGGAPSARRPCCRCGSITSTANWPEVLGAPAPLGHYHDFLAECCVLVAVFVGIGIGEGMPGFGCGVAAGLGTTAIFVLAWSWSGVPRAAIRQPNLLGFSLEDLDVSSRSDHVALFPPAVSQPAGIGAPLFALFVLWECLRCSRRGQSRDHAGHGRDRICRPGRAAYL